MRRQVNNASRSSDDELAALVRAELPPNANRVRIVGDSGMGKTSLLHYCEVQIAKADEGRLPLRVDGLSGYDWKRSRNEVLQAMAERLLHGCLPGDVPAKERDAWLAALKQRVDEGNVVFLLDASTKATSNSIRPDFAIFFSASASIGAPS